MQIFSEKYDQIFDLDSVRTPDSIPETESEKDEPFESYSVFSAKFSKFC